MLIGFSSLKGFNLAFSRGIIDRFNPFHLTADMSPPDSSLTPHPPADMSPPDSSPEPLTDPLDYDAMEDKIDKLKVKLQRLHN